MSYLKAAQKLRGLFFNILMKQKLNQSCLAHICNLSIQEAEARGFKVPGEPGQCKTFVFKHIQTTQPKMESKIQ